MKKRYLLNALLIVLSTIAKADFEITKDYINDKLIIYKNEEKIIVKGNDVNLTNNGVLATTFTNTTATEQSKDKANGVILNQSSKLNTNGIILGEIKLIGASSNQSNLSAWLQVLDSANGVVGNVEANDGVIFGKAEVLGRNANSSGTSRASGDIGKSANGIYGNINKNRGAILSEAEIVGNDSTAISTSGSLSYSDATTRNSINGVYGDVDTNDGIILANAKLKSGKATTIGTDSAQTYAYLYSDNSANGVIGNVIKNSGVISGKGILEGGVAESYAERNITPNSYAHADGQVLNSLNGVRGDIIENNGIILGKGVIVAGTSTSEAKSLDSSELIKSDAFIKVENSGNGVSGRLNNNSGVIAGYIDAKSGIFEENSIAGKDYEKLILSGNGIAGDVNLKIENEGVVKGNQAAISAKSLDMVNNYGVMVGKEIFSDGIEIKKYENNENSIKDKNLNKLKVVNENNYGTYIKLKEDSSNKLKVAFDDEGDVIVEDILFMVNLNENPIDKVNNLEKTILNAKVEDDIKITEKPSDESWIGTIVTSGKDSYIKVDVDSNYDKHIINGAGIKNAVLSVKDDVNVNLTDSIVNGYKTAISLGNNSTVAASNTIFNGGGLKNDNVVIDIIGNNGKLKIDGTSIINGLVTISGENSIINIGNKVLINGDLISKKDNNTLNLGDESPQELKLFHNIDGFSNINTTGKVIAYETANITSGDIHIKNGKFIVRVDGTKIDNISGNVIGHALYEHKGKVTIELPDENILSKDKLDELEDDIPQLVFKASGLGVGTVIAMNGTNVLGLYDPQLGTVSIAHTAIKHKDENGALTGDVEIALLNFDEIYREPTDPPTDPPINSDKVDLGEIYDSIVKGEQLPNLAPTIDTENKTEDEARKGLLSMLDQIYANNPYVQSAKLSKENIVLFREQILSTKMPNENEWITEGHGIYSINEYNKTRGLKVGDTSINNRYLNKTSTTGLLGTGEYGVAENTSLGFVVGGSHQKLDMSMNSRLKGEAIYLGVFGKKKIDKYLFTAGLGYQYGQYDGTRTIMNEYQSVRNTGEVKTDSFDIYGEVRYTFEDEKGRKIEPKLRLSQLFVNQKSVSEKNRALSIDMDKKSYSIPEMEIGVDFIEPIDVKLGKLEIKFGIGAIRTFGENDNYTVARIKNSTNFKVMGPDFDNTKLRISTGLDYEHLNGIFYNTNFGIDIGKDVSKDINIKLGVGYRF